MGVSGQRLAQAEAVRAHVRAGEGGALAGQDGTQGGDGLPRARGGVGPVAVVPAGHDDRAGGAQRERGRAAGEGGDRPQAERERRRAAHADRQRPDRERQAGRAPAHRGGQREGVEALQLADPQALQAGALDRGGDVEGLGRGPVEPERQHALDARAHSIEASACWPSRMRPGSSREAALTWKWAVAVWASRKRRCSGASS